MFKKERRTKTKIKKGSTKILELKTKVGITDWDRAIEPVHERKDPPKKWEETEWNYQEIKEPGTTTIWEDVKDILYFGIWFIIAGLAGGIWKIVRKGKEFNY